MSRKTVLREGSRIAESLVRRGYAVSDLHLQESTVAGLRSEILQLYDDKDPFFSKTGQVAHRSDLTGWIGTSDASNRGLRYLPEVIKTLLEEIPEALHTYQTAQTVQTAQTAQTHQQKGQQHQHDHIPAIELARVLPPDRAMLSVYQDGANYEPHRDGIRQDDVGLFGSVVSTGREYLKNGSNAAMVHMATLNSEVAQREITAILYLNEGDWDVATDGGALRIFADTDPNDLDGRTATTVEDIAPIGGRLVVFKSREVLHTVLPALRRRLAMTAWFLNENAVLGQRTALRLQSE